MENANKNIIVKSRNQYVDFEILEEPTDFYPIDRAREIIERKISNNYETFDNRDELIDAISSNISSSINFWGYNYIEQDDIERLNDIEERVNEISNTSKLINYIDSLENIIGSDKIIDIDALSFLNAVISETNINNVC